MLDLRRVISDRDFHNKQHVELRKDLLNIVKQEYQVDSLKRQNQFLKDEIATYEERVLIYEKQIDELSVLAARPISISSLPAQDQDPGAYLYGTDDQSQEYYFAKVSKTEEIFF